MTSTEIIACTNCKGCGYTTHHEITCYHKNEYDVIRSTCHRCEGSGRQTRQTAITYAPYAPIATEGRS